MAQVPKTEEKMEWKSLREKLAPMFCTITIINIYVFAKYKVVVYL